MFICNNFNEFINAVKTRFVEKKANLREPQALSEAIQEILANQKTALETELKDTGEKIWIPDPSGRTEKYTRSVTRHYEATCSLEIGWEQQEDEVYEKPVMIPTNQPRLVAYTSTEINEKINDYVNGVITFAIQANLPETKEELFTAEQSVVLAAQTAILINPEQLEKLFSLTQPKTDAESIVFTAIRACRRIESDKQNELTRIREKHKQQIAAISRESIAISSQISTLRQELQDIAQLPSKKAGQESHLRYFQQTLESYINPIRNQLEALKPKLPVVITENTMELKSIDVRTNTKNIPEAKAVDALKNTIQVMFDYQKTLILSFFDKKYSQKTLLEQYDTANQLELSRTLNGLACYPSWKYYWKMNSTLIKKNLALKADSIRSKWTYPTTPNANELIENIAQLQILSYIFNQLSAHFDNNHHCNSQCGDAIHSEWSNNLFANQFLQFDEVISSIKHHCKAKEFKQTVKICEQLEQFNNLVNHIQPILAAKEQMATLDKNLTDAKDDHTLKLAEIEKLKRDQQTCRSRIDELTTQHEQAQNEIETIYNGKSQNLYSSILTGARLGTDPKYTPKL